MPQVEQGLGASKGVLRRGEALGDHVGHVVVDDELLGVHHVGEALHAKRLRGRSRDQENVGARRHRVGCLNVERDLEGPGSLVLQPGAVRCRRRRVGCRRTLEVELAERRHAGGAGNPFLAAQRREAECLVEYMQVMRDGVAAVGIDDGDRHPMTVEPCRVQRPEVVGGLE